MPPWILKESIYFRMQSTAHIRDLKNLFGGGEIIWTYEIKINLNQSDWKRRAWNRKGKAHNPKHTTLSVKHIGHGHAFVDTRTGSSGFVDNVMNVTGWILKCIEVYFLLRFNCSKTNGTLQYSWIITQSILRKQPRSLLRHEMNISISAFYFTLEKNKRQLQ